MHIVCATNARLLTFQANSVQVVHVAEAFRSLGHQVSLYARVVDPDASDSMVFSHYGVSTEFELVRMPLGDHVVGSLRRGIAIGRHLDGLTRPTLIYGRYPLGLLQAAIRGLPYAIELHSPPGTVARRIAERYLLGQRTLVGTVFITETLKAHYQASYPGPWLRKPVVVAPDGAKPLSEAPASAGPDQLSRGRLRVAYFGSLYPGKGAHLLKPLAEALPNLEFHVFGGTHETPLLKPPGPGNLATHGPVQPSQVPRLMQSMDILLLPAQTRTTVEGRGNIAEWMSPLKLFEYMAAGRAIVASDLPVLREVLQDGKTALLVPPPDVLAWKEALCTLAHDPVVRADLGANAQRAFLEKYTWERRAQGILDALLDSVPLA